MKTSQEILKKANVTPRLRLFEKLPQGGTKSTGPHKVRILEDRASKDIDPQTGKERHIVIYLVEEDGVKMKYIAPMQSRKDPREPHYLVQRLAVIEEGEEIILEGKKSGKGSYIDVQRLKKVGDDEEDVIDLDREDIEENHGEGGLESDIPIPAEVEE